MLLSTLYKTSSALLFLGALLITAPVTAGNILDLRLSINQAFHLNNISQTQRYSIEGTTLFASNFSFMVRSTSGGFSPMLSAQRDEMVAKNRYFAFFQNPNNSYGIALYESDGTQVEVFHETGRFIAISQEVILFIGDTNDRCTLSSCGRNVVLITPVQGYNFGDSDTWVDVTASPSLSVINNTVFTNTQPLAAGEVAEPIAASPIYRESAITVDQVTSRNIKFADTIGHRAQLTVDGTDNIIYIAQTGASGHYAMVFVQGNSNDVNIEQVSTASARHYIEASIIGSDNIVDATQSDTNKTQFVTVIGNNNAITTSQTGTGNHFLDLIVAGDDHLATIMQQGSGSHEARVELDGSQPWTFNLTQSGGTSQRYSLPHDMSDGSVVSGTCSAVGGCVLSVIQQ